MKKVICLLISLFVSQTVLAINWEKVPTISFGPEVGFKSLSIIEKTSDNAELAKMSKGLSVAPSIVISSNEKYFWEDDNWGYHVQVKGGWFSLNKQNIDDDAIDFNTNVSGFSIYAVPVGYYHFNKHVTDNWTYKLGLGVGAGWLNLDGDFEVTKSNHSLYGQNKKIDTSGLGTAIGIYFEAKYKNHAVVLQNYAPQINDSQFFYQQHNVVIAYRYQIEKQWFKDIFDK